MHARVEMDAVTKATLSHRIAASVYEVRLEYELGSVIQDYQARKAASCEKHNMFQI